MTLAGADLFSGVGTAKRNREGERMTEQNKDQRTPHEHQMKAYHEGIAEAHTALVDAVEGHSVKNKTTVAPTYIPGAQKCTLSDRIEAAYDRAIEQQRLLEYATWQMKCHEEEFKHEYREEWAGLRDDKTREFMLASWLRDDKEYQKARDDRDSAELELELALMETRKLRLLVEARKAEGCY